MWVAAEDKSLTAMALHRWAQPWRQGGAARDLNGARNRVMSSVHQVDGLDVCTSGQAESPGSCSSQAQLEGQQTQDKLGNLHDLSSFSIQLSMKCYSSSQL